MSEFEIYNQSQPEEKIDDGFDPLETIDIYGLDINTFFHLNQTQLERDTWLKEIADMQQQKALEKGEA